MCLRRRKWEQHAPGANGQLLGMAVYAAGQSKLQVCSVIASIMNAPCRSLPDALAEIAGLRVSCNLDTQSAGNTIVCCWYVVASCLSRLLRAARRSSVAPMNQICLVDVPNLTQIKAIGMHTRKSDVCTCIVPGIHFLALPLPLAILC